MANFRMIEKHGTTWLQQSWWWFPFWVDFEEPMSLEEAEEFIQARQSGAFKAKVIKRWTA